MHDWICESGVTTSTAFTYPTSSDRLLSWKNGWRSALLKSSNRDEVHFTGTLVIWVRAQQDLRCHSPWGTLLLWSASQPWGAADEAGELCSCSDGAPPVDRKGNAVSVISILVTIPAKQNQCSQLWTSLRLQIHNKSVSVHHYRITVSKNCFHSFAICRMGNEHLPPAGRFWHWQVRMTISPATLARTFEKSIFSMQSPKCRSWSNWPEKANEVRLCPCASWLVT